MKHFVSGISSQNLVAVEEPAVVMGLLAPALHPYSRQILTSDEYILMFYVDFISDNVIYAKPCIIRKFYFKVTRKFIMN